MNEQTAALVSQLAAKLGTTTEYLWSVLLKQAPVSGAILLAEYVLTAIALYLFFKYRGALSATWLTWVKNEEITAVVGFVVAGCVMVIWLLSGLFSFGSMLTAFLNPEYWALREVLSVVKNK